MTTTSTTDPDGRDPRRRTPGTDTVLSDPRLSDALATAGRARVKAAIHAAQQEVRAGALDPSAVVDTVLAAVASTATTPGYGPTPVLNATGVIVHTNLGRAPLSDAARNALLAAAGTTDVEFDLASGTRTRRGTDTLDALAAAVPDAGDVHVVNNNAAALLLCALALAPGKDVVLSRGQFVEIGDGFRVPELLSSAGAQVREVGTTNRTRLADYERAVGPDTGFVLAVHPSNFQVVGYTASVDVRELATLGVPVIVDIGSGLLTPHPSLPDEPDATSMLHAGASLVTASADKLLGGPQAGLLMGDAGLVRQLRRHPSARALRVDKLTLAALEATLRTETTPVSAALQADESALAERAARLADRLSADAIDACAVGCTSVVGGGGAPGARFASHGLGLPESYGAALRTGQPPVVGRIVDGRCVLDLRTVAPAEDDTLVDAITRVARGIVGETDQG